MFVILSRKRFPTNEVSRFGNAAGKELIAFLDESTTVFILGVENGGIRIDTGQQALSIPLTR